MNIRSAALRSLRIAVFLGSLAAIILASTVPAEAFSQAFFPTQSTGNKGTDVAAIQYLLRQRGHDIPVSGNFDDQTRGAVQTFQGNHQLPRDGIVGPATWAKLAPDLRLGSRGAAVSALQHELNQKRGAGLAINGHFDAATRGAVIAFQRHAGLGADGVVGDLTWRNLTWHYERPNFRPASLCAHDGGNGSAGKWGTAALVRQLEVAAAHAFRGADGPISVGDIALEHGGPIVGHESHEVGLDVDIWLMRDDRQQCTRPTTYTQAVYDRAATRRLVRAIRAAAPGHVKLIFFNDPVLIREGLTTPFPNHDDHLHVRYCERSHPNPLYTC